MGMGIIIIMVSVGPPFWRLKRGSTRLRPVSMRSGSRRRPRTSFLRGSVPPIPNSREYRAARWFSLRQRAGSPAEARGLELGERKLFKVDERARLLGLEARVREEVDEEGVLEGHLLLGAEHAHIEEVVHLVGVGLRVPLGEGLVHDAALGTRAVSLEDHGGGGRVVEDHGPATPENLAPRVVPAHGHGHGRARGGARARGQGWGAVEEEWVPPRTEAARACVRREPGLTRRARISSCRCGRWCRFQT
mmetsp:Transcript_24570/g.76561  ORF Transcript_24570/g.76561 Transcript_24570/m.76561 type:complete len:248 (+) Transcript_24570:54-797(+)